MLSTNFIYYFGLFIINSLLIFNWEMTFAHHSFNNYILVISEICFLLVLTNVVNNSAIRLKSEMVKLLTFVVGIVFSIQFFSLYFSLNYITLLAMKNASEGAVISRSLLLSFLIAILVWWIICYVFLQNKLTARAQMKQESLVVKFVKITLLVCFGLSLAFINKINAAGVVMQSYQSPFFSLMATSYVFISEKYRGIDDVKGVHLKNDLYRSTDENYPFQKNEVYEENNTRVSFDSHQKNIVVIFAEGLSARMLGAYGGGFTNLTPNIDHYSTKGLIVDNYFNHTAATFLGIKGQLTSGYPSKAVDESNINELSTVLNQTKYASLPQILNEQGYKSAFFMPHDWNNVLPNLALSLGFQKIYTDGEIVKLNGVEKPEYVNTYLSDKDVFLGLTNYFEQFKNEKSEARTFTAVYTMGTHAFLDVGKMGKKYGDGSNPILNRIFNYDYHLGNFLNYFYSSGLSKNTILIITSDHASYPEPTYVSLQDKSYKAYFVDKIPFIVLGDDVKNGLYNAEYKTSIDFAPSILNILNINSAHNSFLGRSIFEKKRYVDFGYASIGNDGYMINQNGVFPRHVVPEENQIQFKLMDELVASYRALEQRNQIFTNK